MVARTAVVATALASLLSVAGPVLAGGVPIPVRDRRAFEEQPAASDGYLVWSQEGASLVKPNGLPKIRMNPPGTRSFAASIDGTTAIFQQRVGGQDDLFLFDVLTETISDPPDGVNTSDSEREPAISGDWLLFNRTTARRSKVVLFNLTTSEERVLANLRARTNYLVSDQVNGDWVTWESCDYLDYLFSDCQAFRYRISDESVETLPNPGKQQYAAGVTSDGTAYLVRTGRRTSWRCGAGSRIVRVLADGSTSVIAALPKGVDSLNTFAFEEYGGTTTLYLEWLSCREGLSDIYKIENADTA